MRACIGVVICLLLISYAFSSSSAVPTTRSLKSITQNQVLPIQDLVAQGAMELRGDDGVSEIGSSSSEEFIEGRMDMESTDYPGTGANNHHDPKTPGRA